MRRALAGLALAVIALLVAGAGPHGPARAAAATTTDDGMHHAAIVVDTGDGQVRKMCLAFPEAELDGIEALRRVDTRPYRFETYGSKGAAVCMLCGTGCPSGDCFCDSSKYWAYFRAGPGGETYQASRVGASSTKVQDGDVEGWKWGKGDAPPAATVGEVCDVPEPPKRTASVTTTTSATDVSTTAPSADPTTISPTTSPPVPPPAAGPSATTTPPARLATTTTSTIGAADQPVGASATGSDTGAGPEASEAGDTGQAALAARSAAQGVGAASTTHGAAHRAGSLAGAVAFGLALAGLLAWRVRLRRSKAARAEVRG